MRRLIGVVLSGSLLSWTWTPALAAGEIADGGIKLVNAARGSVIESINSHLDRIEPLLPVSGAAIEPNIISAYVIQNTGFEKADRLPEQMLVESLVNPEIARRTVNALALKPDQQKSLERLSNISLRLQDSDKEALSSEIKRMEKTRQILASESNPTVAVSASLHLFDGADVEAPAAPVSAATTVTPSFKVKVEQAKAIAKQQQAAQQVAQALIGRMEKLGTPRSSVGEILQNSRSLTDPLPGLEKLGLLQDKDKEFLANPPAARLVYETLWRAVSDQTPPTLFSYNFARALPAIIVRRDGIDFHIYGLVHGSILPPFWSFFKIRRLLKNLQQEGHQVYGEDMLLQRWGFHHGQETSDQNISQGDNVVLRSPRSVGEGIVANLFDVGIFAAGGAILGLLAHLIHPAWGLAVGNGALWGLKFLIARRFYQTVIQIPFHNLVLRVTAALDHNPYSSSRTMTYVMRPIVDVVKARATQLPMPLRMDHSDDRNVLVRSQAMAELIFQDAIDEGLREVHLLTGFFHAEEIAWFLTHLPSPKPAKAARDMAPRSITPGR